MDGHRGSCQLVAVADGPIVEVDQSGQFVAGIEMRDLVWYGRYFGHHQWRRNATDLADQ